MPTHSCRLWKLCHTEAVVRNPAARPRPGTAGSYCAERAMISVAWPGAHWGLIRASLAQDLARFTLIPWPLLQRPILSPRSVHVEAQVLQACEKAGTHRVGSALPAELSESFPGGRLQSEHADPLGRSWRWYVPSPEMRRATRKWRASSVSCRKSPSSGICRSRGR